MSVFVDGIQFVTEICCNCGIPFAFTKDFHDRRRNDRKDFYCPAGHAQHYAGKSEAQKLREELERKQRLLEAESGRAAALAHQRDQIARSYNKIRTRVKNGVCPCCTRTFQNLLQHMRTEHPDFDTHETLKALRDAFGLTQSAVANEIGIAAPYISQYERGKPVSSYAKARIESWIESNA